MLPLAKKNIGPVSHSSAALVPSSQQQTQEGSGFVSAPLLAFMTLGNLLIFSESQLSDLGKG